jgi:hypothetical protein
VNDRAKFGGRDLAHMWGGDFPDNWEEYWEGGRRKRAETALKTPQSPLRAGILPMRSPRDVRA